MQYSGLASVIAAAAIAVGALTMTSPTADAKPKKLSEDTIKSECKKAGGTYTHEGSWSGCRYKDISGTTHLDEYIDGVYLEQ